MSMSRMQIQAETGASRVGPHLTGVALVALMLTPVRAVASLGTDAPIVFPPHPRVEYTAVELQAWKSDTNRAAERQAAIRRADEILKTPLVVPDKGGQWHFYYACRKDGAHPRAESPERHVCPVCKAVYTDERTIAAYRTTLHDQLNAQCHDLAVAYGLTGDVRYAKPVRQAFLDLARIFPTLERHDRWGRTGLLAVVGGKRYAQHLDEAVSMLKLAAAYDLVADAPCFTDVDRRAVEQDFLAATVREIRKYQWFVGSRNNHQTWFNAAYTVVGLAIGDADLIREGVYGGCGLMWQLENSVTEDGIWYEGTVAYHFYALSAIRQTLDALRRIGWDFSGHARLKSLWSGPLQLAYPNGQFPVMHDSDPADLRRYAEHYRWARDYFKEPTFGGVGGATPDAGAGSPRLASAALKGIGIVALRRGAGKNAVCAMVDYGLHGDHHGHPDKLNIVLYALGSERILDPGRLTYSVPEYETWCRTTLAHNTVVLDERNQEATTGELWHFADTPEYAACLCASDGAYPGYWLKRFLVLTDRFLVDVLAVEGRHRAQMDWALHCRGCLRLPSEERSAPLKGPLGKRAGYQHLGDVARAEGTGRAVAEFVQKDGRVLRLLLRGDDKSAFYMGTGIGYALNDKAPVLLRRRRAESTAFVTVLDLSGTNAVREVEIVPVAGEGKPMALWEAVGVRVTETNRVTTIGMDLRQAPVNRGVLDGDGFDRLYLRVRNRR